MDIGTIKILDKYVGGLICLVLSLFKKKESDTRDKILFIQLWGIGETLLTIPALEHLRNNNPDSQIDVLTTYKNREVFEGYPTLHFDIKIIPMSLLGILKFIKNNLLKYDEVYDMEEYLNISSIIGFFVGKEVYGFSHGFRGRIYNSKIDYDDTLHAMNNFCSITGRYKYPMALPKYQTKPKEYIKKLFKGRTLGACITLSENGRGREWPREKWMVLFELIKEKFKCNIVLIGGKEELSYLKEFKENFKSRTGCNLGLLIGKPLNDVFYFIENCNLFISIDTGPMHMASAQGIPTIGLFGPNIPSAYGAYGKHCINLYKGRCKYSLCIIPYQGKISECKNKGGNVCMKKIRVKGVMEYVEAILGESIF